LHLVAPKVKTACIFCEAGSSNQLGAFTNGWREAKGDAASTFFERATTTRLHKLKVRRRRRRTPLETQTEMNLTFEAEMSARHKQLRNLGWNSAKSCSGIFQKTLKCHSCVEPLKIQNKIATLKCAE
jgi:DnaJ-class molecular chaperone